MKTLLTYIYIIFIALSVTACTFFERKSHEDVVLDVAGQKLYSRVLDEIVHPGVSLEDSAKIVDKYIEQWVTNALIYDLANKNMTNASQIDEMVDAYRKSLILYNYEQNILKQNFTSSISEEQTLAFYEKYGAELVLDHNLIKGLFLVVSKDAPNLDDARKWLRDADTLSLENIEKYVIENIASYDYFLDDWIKFNDVLRYYPDQIPDQEKFLKKNSYTEYTDSTKTYIWVIKDYQLRGTSKPYEYALPEIKKILLNKEKTKFIQELKKDLYQRAIENGTVVKY